MQMISNEAVEAAAMASKYRKYERDYLRRINHLYFSSALPDNSGNTSILSVLFSLREFIRRVQEYCEFNVFVIF